MKFGVREICDVVLKAKAKQKIGNKTFLTDEPVIYFDTAKTSSLEGAATTVYATGGRGNSQLIAWEGERTLTFTLEDALLSPKGFAILSGAGLVEATESKPIYVHQTTQLYVSKGDYEGTAEGKAANSFQLLDENGAPIAVAHDNSAAKTFILILNNDDEMEYEPCVPCTGEGDATDLDAGIIACHTLEDYFTSHDEAIVLVDYYVKKTSSTTQIEITPDKFGGYFYLEASTLFRKESTGMDMPAEFVVPKVKVQSNFTFSMAATGDPSTFPFTMDAFPDYIKFDKTKKVLAAIQIIDESVAEEEEVPKCPPGTENASVEDDEML